MPAYARDTHAPRRVRGVSGLYQHRVRGDEFHLLCHGHELEYVAVRVFEIEATATIPVIELAVIEAPGGAAVCKPRLPDWR